MKNAEDLAKKNNLSLERITEDEPDEGIMFSVNDGDKTSVPSDGEGISRFHKLFVRDPLSNSWT